MNHFYFAIIFSFFLCACGQNPQNQNQPNGNVTAYLEKDCLLKNTSGEDIEVKIAVFQGENTSLSAIVTTPSTESNPIEYTVNREPPNGAGIFGYLAQGFRFQISTQMSQIGLDDDNQNLHLTGPTSDCKSLSQ